MTSVIQPASRPEQSQGPTPGPPCTLTLVVPPPLTFFSSFLAGLPPGSEALGSVEKHCLSLGRPCLGGQGWGGALLPPSLPRTGTGGNGGFRDLPATSAGAPPHPEQWWRAEGAVCVRTRAGSASHLELRKGRQSPSGLGRGFLHPPSWGRSGRKPGKVHSGSWSSRRRPGCAGTHQ